MKQGLSRNANPRSNGASQVLTFLCYETEGRGSAEIHDDYRAAVSAKSGRGIDDAIGADFRRVFVPQRQAGLQLGGDGERDTVEIFFGKFFECGREGRYDARQNHRIKAFRDNAFYPEQV